MTQTFQDYLQQHDGSNEFQNRRRARALAQARKNSPALVAQAVSQSPIVPADAWDEEYLQWKREMGLDVLLSEEEERKLHVTLFNPNGIE